MILVAPDSFKETFSAVEVCEIVREEFYKRDNSISVCCVPVADGGEGTVDALLFNGGERIAVTVNDPYFNPVKAVYGILPDGTAVIEMAAASGLPLVGDNKNPLQTTTYGTGELIKDAMARNCKKILLGIGGSATNDGGIGCVSALGGKFLDKDLNEVPLCGKGLEKIKSIDLNGLDERLKITDIRVLCDVVSPLYGEKGAAYIFAPQKGADKDMVKRLDNGLVNLADVTCRTIGKDNSHLAGTGAAGGLGFALISFLGGELVPGAVEILKAMDFENLAKKAELVITGEGCMDSQSLLGKAPAVVASMSGDTPVIAVVGMSKVESGESAGIKKIYVSNYRNRTFDEVLKHCREDLTEAVGRIIDDYLKNNGKM